VIEGESNNVVPGRDGGPSFMWVQDFDDAYQAARVSRGVELVVPAAIYQEWVATGEAPHEPPHGVRLSES
jgi:hypothetical protein